MAKMRLFLDTNVMVDYLHQREGFYEPARRLMICGRVGEFELITSASQWTDLVFILFNGGRKSEMPVVLEKLRGLRTFVDVCALGASEVDGMLRTSWADPEDALIYECALSNRADAIITRNKQDFEGSLLKAMDCTELFSWLEEEKGISYAEIAF